MLFGPKLPISEDQRQWVDSSFWRLARLLGRNRLIDAKVVLPTDQYFPDPFDGSDDAVKTLFARVCSYMAVDRTQIDLHLLADNTATLRDLWPFWGGESRGCAGLYMHESDDLRLVIVLDGSNSKDPHKLVATMAHELGHAILLGRKLVGRSETDMEPFTDLLTVFLGFGVFTANACARFRQFQDERKIGWSMDRLGYLPQDQLLNYPITKLFYSGSSGNP